MTILVASRTLILAEMATSTPVSVSVTKVTSAQLESVLRFFARLELTSPTPVKQFVSTAPQDNTVMEMILLQVRLAQEEATVPSEPGSTTSILALLVPTVHPPASPWQASAPPVMMETTANSKVRPSNRQRCLRDTTPTEKLARLSPTLISVLR